MLNSHNSVSFVLHCVLICIAGKGVEMVSEEKAVP